MPTGLQTSFRRAYRRAYESYQFRLRSFAGGRFAAKCRPTWISFLLTERCNARCVHCDIWRNRGKEDSPTVDQWKSALHDLRSWLGPAHVCLTGGEALLRPFTVELVEYGSKIGLFIELLTHGFWKDQGRIEAAARARPWRMTLSLDGLGATHDGVRGREGFFERTNATIDTLKRLRREEGLDYSIRLKTVVMSHNLDDLGRLARFASTDGVDILYQAVVQNYGENEPDQQWFERTDNWPRDPARVEGALRELIDMKRDGYHIANTAHHLEEMTAYFNDPVGQRAHDWGPHCAALGLLQVHANGDVRVCSRSAPVGNIKETRPRHIWVSRPRLWESGCCREDELS
jgi:MoaA/NifB/PqqE/SkfB family radical SAM enzyme